MQPKRFSTQAIEQKRLQMYRQFYGTASIVRRMLETAANMQDPWHLLVYLMINLPGYTQENARTGKRLALTGSSS